jgi:hypothetical protein
MLRGSVINDELQTGVEQLEMPTVMRIMEDVFIGSIAWLRQSTNRVIRTGITHIIISEELVD